MIFRPSVIPTENQKLRTCNEFKGNLFAAAQRLFMGSYCATDTISNECLEMKLKSVNNLPGSVVIW